MLSNTDQQITLLINLLLPHNQFFDAFFSFFSLRGIAFFIWIALAIFLVFIEEKKYPGISKKDRMFILSFSVSLLLTFVLVNYLVKPIVHRPRPITLSNCPKDFSFPSSHAAIAGAAACILSFFDKKRRFFYWIIALLISLSRIYLGCHYFIDVVAGVFIGYLISMLTLILAKRLFEL